MTRSSRPTRSSPATATATSPSSTTPRPAGDPRPDRRAPVRPARIRRAAPPLDRSSPPRTIAHLLRLPRRQGRRPGAVLRGDVGHGARRPRTASARRSSGPCPSCSRRWPRPCRPGPASSTSAARASCSSAPSAPPGWPGWCPTRRRRRSPCSPWPSAAAVLGAAWAAIPALLRLVLPHQRGHLQPAAQLRRRPDRHLAVLRALEGPRQPRPGVSPSSSTANERLPILWGARVHAGILVALAIGIVAAGVLLRSTTWGFKLSGARRQPRGRPPGRPRRRRPLDRRRSCVGGAHRRARRRRSRSPASRVASGRRSSPATASSASSPPGSGATTR